MLYFTGLLLLVIAVSLDGFGVGITYGMQKIKVPFNALFIIMLCSGLVLLASMTIGRMLEAFISADTAKILGGVILITIGLFSLFNIIRSKLKKQHVSIMETDTSTFDDIKTVLATPDKADLDRSGTISASEALLLGFALSLDAFGAGIGASMLGYAPVLTACSNSKYEWFISIFWYASRHSFSPASEIRTLNPASSSTTHRTWEFQYYIVRKKDEAIAASSYNAFTKPPSTIND